MALNGTQELDPGQMNRGWPAIHHLHTFFVLLLTQCSPATCVTKANGLLVCASVSLSLSSREVPTSWGGFEYYLANSCLVLGRKLSIW